MATCEHDTSIEALELPREFEDLEGLLQADLRAVVAMLSERAHERLLLSRREYQQLQVRLWNGLAGALNEAVEPLSADRR
ncbi:MAG TPA: hypothetical protein VG406_21950 [Isosphaeraceae bacterium]|jgi:hypothetical protein|nr:hypothetical protein [Isosphaeraceae bacterium]